MCKDAVKGKHVDTVEGPVGLLSIKSFCNPHFFDYRK